MIPELYVVGAGPGDPELITVKAFRLLEKAKVVLYDNLANKDLLALTPKTCENIYVGKHPYGSYTPQEKIHELIKDYASKYGQVIRLKGGDPFIFGRGFEEIIYARQQGIKTHYVPGITSMQAVGFEDIPLTHRALSEGIWVVTGTKKDGFLSDDLELALQSKATVVIYMGMKKIKDIAAAYIKTGNGDMPAAIVQHASLPHRKVAFGRAADLPEIAKTHQLTHPAIIIIGQVVSVGNLV